MSSELTTGSGKNLTAHWTRLVDSEDGVPTCLLVLSSIPRNHWPRLAAFPTLGWLPGVSPRCHSARHNPTELGNHNFCVTRCQTVDPCGEKYGNLRCDWRWDKKVIVRITHGQIELHASSTLGIHHLGHTFGALRQLWSDLRLPLGVQQTRLLHWMRHIELPETGDDRLQLHDNGHVRWPLLRQDARTWLHRRSSRRCCPLGSTAVRGDAVKCVATPTTVGAHAATNVDTMRKKTPDSHVERKRPKKWLEPKRRDDVICDATKVLQSATLYTTNTSPMCTTTKWQTSTLRICHSLSSVWFRLPCPPPFPQDTPATRQKILGDDFAQCHEWRSVFRVFGGVQLAAVFFLVIDGFFVG